MSTSSILTACLDKLILFAAGDEYPIAHPGIKFTPPDTGFWLEPKLFPNEPQNYGWQDASCVNELGFFQVLVMYRHGAGHVAATTVADSIVNYFAKGTALGPVSIYKRPHQGPAVILDDKAYIPVTIQYRGLVAIDTTVDESFYVVNGGVNVVNNTIQVVNTL